MSRSYLWQASRPEYLAHTAAAHQARTEVLRAIANWLVARSRTWLRAYRRRHAIAQLEALDDRRLADIGLSRDDIALAVDQGLDRQR